MAAQLVALFHTPPDPAAFLEHYRTVHVPLVRAMPGLRAFRVSIVRDRVMGDGDWFLMAVMEFSDRAALDAAMASPEGRAAGRDVARLAGSLVTLLTTDTWDGPDASIETV
jgi:uncharacterized protein (TIGR02118 family)